MVVTILDAALAKDPEGLGVVQVVARYHQLQDQEPFKENTLKGCQKTLYDIHLKSGTYITIYETLAEE